MFAKKAISRVWVISAHPQVISPLPRPFIIPSVDRYVDFIEPELEEAGVEDVSEFINEQIQLNGGVVK